MSVHSVRGRNRIRIRKGPAKVIPLPTGRRYRHYRHTIEIGIASLATAMAGAALVWLYLMPLIELAPDLTAGMSTQEMEILRLTNEERRRDGEAPLKSSRRLVLASRSHSYDMALRKYLGDNGPGGDTPADRVHGVGVDYKSLGENIYLEDNADPAKLPHHVVEKWLLNPEHRANMLSPDFASTGIGVARAADGTAYVTQDFVQ